MTIIRRRKRRPQNRAPRDEQVAREGTFLELESDYEGYCNGTATGLVRVGTQWEGRRHRG